MRSITHRLAAATFALGLALAAVPASAQTYYTINGQPAPYDIQAYMASNGLAPGHYWLNGQGYWGRMGNPNPLGNLYAGQYSSGSGYGEQASNGWVHNTPGFSVGGDSNGCLYTTSGWSNC